MSSAWRVQRINGISRMICKYRYTIIDITSSFCKQKQHFIDNKNIFPFMFLKSKWKLEWKCDITSQLFVNGPEKHGTSLQIICTCKWPHQVFNSKNRK